MIWHLIDTRSVGGAERHIANLMLALRRRQIATKAVLYCDYGRNPWLDQLAAERLSFQVLGGRFVDLLGVLSRQRPALLHTHGYKAGILGRLAARLCRIPVVSTFHSGERFGWPVNAYEWLDEWTALLGQRIAVSAAVQQRLPFSSTVIPSFVVMSNGDDCATFPSRVGFVGRLSPEKGPDIFCALAERASGGGEWHVFGDGPMRRDLEVKYGATVRFHGVVTDLAPIWASLGLLIMPSRFEGLPLAALEALANGVPVLASRVGALPELVRDDVTGWLFERENVDDALNGLRRWQSLGASAQVEMRRSCRSYVQDHYSEAKQIPKLLAIYRRAGYREHEAATTLLHSDA